jgi:DNA-binding MarR family transcriptional regulator
MAENNKWVHQKALDKVDFYILSLVGEGAGSCSYLSSVLGISKAGVTNRVQVLSKMGYVISKETDREYYYRRYELTTEGSDLIEETRIFLNLLHLRRQKTS